MRSTLIIIPLVLTAACSSPQERCISGVTQEVRVLDQLIAETRGNLSRGFALDAQQEVRTRRSTCTGRNEDGTAFKFRCDKTDTITRNVPVAIDLNAEREKLTSLEQRQAQNRINAASGIAQCQAQFPAG